MAEEPDTAPWEWASAPGAGDPGQVAPNQAEILTGYRDGQAPTAGAFNWWRGSVGRWVQYLREALSDAQTELVTHAEALGESIANDQLLAGQLATLSADLTQAIRDRAKQQVSNWTRMTLPGAGSYVAVAAGYRSADATEPVLVAVGGTEGALTSIAMSVDGLYWEERTLAMPYSDKMLYSVVYHQPDRKWILAGEAISDVTSGVLWVTEDPLEGAFVEVSGLEAAAYRAVVSTGDYVYALGDVRNDVDLPAVRFRNGTINSFWSIVEPAALEGYPVYAAAAVGEGVFVLVGGDADHAYAARYSSGFKAVTLPATLTRRSRSVVYNGRVAMLVCDDGRVATSSDAGATWVERTPVGALNSVDDTLLGAYLAADPATGTVVGTTMTQDGAVKGVYATFDDGETWQECATFQQAGADSIARGQVRAMGFALGRFYVLLDDNTIACSMRF